MEQLARARQAIAAALGNPNHPAFEKADKLGTVANKTLVRGLIKDLKTSGEDLKRFLQKSPEERIKQRDEHVTTKNEQDAESAKLLADITTTKQTLAELEEKKERLDSQVTDVTHLIGEMKKALKNKIQRKKEADAFSDDLGTIIQAMNNIINHGGLLLSAAWQTIDAIQQNWQVTNMDQVKAIANGATFWKQVSESLFVEGLHLNKSFQGPRIKLDNTSTHNVEQRIEALALWFQVPKDANEERKRRGEQLKERLAKRRRSSIQESDSDDDDDNDEV